jgi:hypothetical protein
MSSALRNSRNLDKFKCLGFRHDLAVEADQMIAAPIAGLLLCGRPSNVTWLVVAIIVDSI